jgi:predicted permease
VVSRAASHRTRALLLASQSAFAVVLLIAAVLLARSFATLLQVDAGYTREGVVVADVLRPDTTQESAQRYAPLMHQALENVQALPDVSAAALASMSPLDSNTQLQAFPVPGSLSPIAGGFSPRTALTRSYAVSPGYAAAVGLRVKAGRFLEDSDAVGDDARWVVNEEFARLYLPANPAGRRFPWRRGNQDIQLEIVGVVGNVLKDGNAATPSPEIYRILQSSEPFFNYQVVARTSADPDTLISSLRGAITAVAPDATVNVVRLSGRFADSVAQPRLATTVFTGMALAAASLTVLGLVAVLSFSMSERRQEFGIRVAIGATITDIVGLLVWQGIVPTAVGIAFGVVAAFGSTRFMQGALFGISPLDSLSFAVAPLLLLVAATLACLLPALRVARIDPATTLRAE